MIKEENKEEIKDEKEHSTEEVSGNDNQGVFSKESYNRLPNAIKLLEELCHEINTMPSPGLRSISPHFWEQLKTRLNSVLSEILLSRKEAKESRLASKIREKVTERS